MAVDGDKIKAVMKWTQPKNIRELGGFLGLTGYYRKFVAKYAQLARPLNEQLKKDCFGWNEAADRSFQLLKDTMVKPPVLIMPNFQQEFVVETDASGFGVGAVLMQNNRPVAYFSKLLGVKARQKSIYEKELIAICMAVQCWKHYLLGRHFIIRSDQQSLRFLTQQREVNHEYQKWVTKLLGFDFEIQFKPGSANRVADALSRKQNGEVGLNALVTSTEVIWGRLLKDIEEDTEIQTIIKELHSGENEHKNFSVVGGRLFFKGR